MFTPLMNDAKLKVSHRIHFIKSHKVTLCRKKSKIRLQKCTFTPRTVEAAVN